MASKLTPEVIECRRCGNPFETEMLRSEVATLPMRCYCDACFSVALDEFRREEREQEARRRRSQWLSGPGREAFRDTKPETLPKPELFAKVTGWKCGPRGLVLYGPSGRGKSRCLWALLERLFVFDLRGIEFVRASSLARTVSDPLRETEGLLRHLCAVEVLAIDDLGKDLSTERWEAALTELLDIRSIAGRPVLITTNHVGDKLMDRFRDRHTGEAIVRRLREFCEPVSFL